MGRRKHIKVLLLTLVLLMSNSISVFADTTADLYRLYGISDPPKVEDERVVLDEILNEWYNTSSKLDSYKMMDAATLLYETQYMELMQSMDINLLSVGDELLVAAQSIKDSGSGSVEDIIKSDVVYRMKLSEYNKLSDERILLASKLSNVRYENPDKDVLSKQVDQLKKEAEKQEKILEYAKSFTEIGKVGNNKYPISSFKRISSPYGWRLDPIGRVLMEFHSGIDFSAPNGTNVLAQFSGIVEAVKETKSGGKTVVINHGNNVRTVYIHLSDYKVKVGDKVEQYSVIALSGNTGDRTTGPHLHFALFIGGSSYDPARLYR